MGSTKTHNATKKQMSTEMTTTYTIHTQAIAIAWAGGAGAAQC